MLSEGSATFDASEIARLTDMYTAVRTSNHPDTNIMAANLTFSQTKEAQDHLEGVVSRILCRIEVPREQAKIKITRLVVVVIRDHGMLQATGSTAISPFG